MALPFTQHHHLSRELPALLLLIGAAAVDIAFFYTLPLRYLYPVTFSDDGEEVQAAAILFNDFNPTFTGINNETRRRLHHGMSLMDCNRVQQLIVVGGNREASERKGAQFMADYLLEHGVPAEKIRVEASSKDSMSNLEQLGKMARARKIDSLALVSSPYHLLRLQTMRIPISADLRLYAYNPADCTPPLTRSEVWFSAHYNALAYAAQLILPESSYRRIVLWIREHTEW
jgi:vancomycin permeability regulator SanA